MISRRGLSGRTFYGLSSRVSAAVLEAIAADDPDKVLPLIERNPKVPLDRYQKLLRKPNSDKQVNVLNYISFFNAKRCFAALYSSPCIERYNLGEAVAYAAEGNSVDILRLLPYQEHAVEIIEDAVTFSSMDVLRFMSEQGLFRVEYHQIGGWYISANPTPFFKSSCKRRRVNQFMNIQELIEISCEHGHVEALRFLLDIAPQRLGIGCLITACRSGHLGIVKFLVENGMDPCFHKEGGDTPVLSAIKSGSFRVLEYFHSEGFNVFGPFDGLLSLVEAAGRGQLDIANFLIRNGASVNTPDGNGETPIAMACSCGRLEMIKLLIAKGADYHDSTLLLKAMKSKNSAVLTYLMEELNLRFPTESGERAGYFKELLWYGLLDLFDSFYTEEDTLQVKFNEDLLIHLMQKSDEKTIRRLLDLDLIVFPDEPVMIRNECLKFFNDVSLPTLEKMFEKGLQIDAFDWDDASDYEFIADCPERNLELILNHTKRLGGLIGYALDNFGHVNEFDNPQRVVRRIKLILRYGIDSGEIYDGASVETIDFTTGVHVRFLLRLGLDIRRLKPFRKGTGEFSVGSLLVEEVDPEALLLLGEHGFFSVISTYGEDTLKTLTGQDGRWNLRKRLYGPGKEMGVWFNFLRACEANSNFPPDGYTRLRSLCFKQ